MKYITEGYMKEFDEIIQNLKLWVENLPDDESQQEKPEWEKRLICELEGDGKISTGCHDCIEHIKSLIRQEFKDLCNAIWNSAIDKAVEVITSFRDEVPQVADGTFVDDMVEEFKKLKEI